MTQETTGTLQALLASDYNRLLQKLTRKLKSAEHAQEALQDAYLRLNNATLRESPRNPEAYLLRIAFNAAHDRMRSNKRLLNALEIDEIRDLAAADPDATEVLQSRQEAAELAVAIADLPERRRDMLIAARLDQTPHHEIARKFGVSTRTVETELSRALDHCASRVGRPVIRRFGPASKKPSIN